ncbi:MAG: hypothetical protein R6U63_05900 [Longimicrobiales bacterium]
MAQNAAAPDRRSHEHDSPRRRGRLRALRVLRLVDLEADMVRTGGILGLLAAALMVFATCDSGVGPEGGEVVVDTFPVLSASETAQLLAASGTAERGVKSLLRNLGIGVYDTAAIQLSPGSATGPDDFWVYDLVIPTLAVMATAPERTFADFHGDLVEVGLALDPARLLAVYRDTYAAHSDGFLSRLFAALGVDWTAAPAALQLSPLEEWLLYLDGFVPPNPQPGTAATAADGPGAADVAADAGAAVPCRGFDTGLTAGWGRVHGTRPRRRTRRGTH